MLGLVCLYQTTVVLIVNLRDSNKDVVPSRFRKLCCFLFCGLWQG